MTSQSNHKKADHDTTEVITHMLDNKKIAFDKNLDDVFGCTEWDKDKKYFHIMPHVEPHSRRRKAILSKYRKEIEEVMKIKEPKSLLISILVTVI